ncbi:MAG TPA: hypothetical protein PLG59_04120 [bacterium]|nr:hypothetical protein [bacterium]HQO33822.1 hypothetical protein [bacterium]HQP97517.1 hypothetical protein [bacterium]
MIRIPPTIFCFVAMFLLTIIASTAFSQQTVRIGPQDDVIAVLQSVTQAGSTILFEPGYYSLTPKADGTGFPNLFHPPSGTVIRGSGSGFGPDATVLDCNYAFNSGIRIGTGTGNVTVENLTVLNTLHALILIEQRTSNLVFRNVWALKCLDECVQNEGGDVVFESCVLGWCTDNIFFSDDLYPSVSVLMNCDVLLGFGDLVQAETGAEVHVRNSILYAGPGENDIHVDGGWIVVRASVGWDPINESPPGLEPGVRWGRLELDGFPDVNATNVGEDPLYVSPPGRGAKAETMDLHLQTGSPALTAGRESYTQKGEPTGGVTFAGSQGPAPVNVDHWSIY